MSATIPTHSLHEIEKWLKMLDLKEVETYLLVSKDAASYTEQENKNNLPVDVG